MKVLKPSQRLNRFHSNVGPSIFLAGSIEQGTAENWQARVERMLDICDCIILNPRRDNWDASLEQDEGNKQFRQQVKWERNAINMANYKIFYFQPGTQSPVSLLELGEFGDESDTFVVCPKEFWRKGNVDIFCEDKNIPVYDTLEEAVQEIKNIIEDEY